MATSKNGLKTLWVPGKKQNKKGKIETTKKDVNYTQPQKKSEQWTLGGTKAMENLIKCDVQLELVNGVLPSTSKNDIDAIHVLDSKDNIIETDNQNKENRIEDIDEIQVCNIDETDSKENTSAQKRTPQEERYEKLVTCLYYTLNLCECSIS